MITLGLNAVFHDSAACLVQDGRILCAAEEERFSRIKHGKRPVPFSTWELPFNAVAWCLKQAGLRLTDVDRVAYSFDPSLLRQERGETITLPLEPSAHPLPEEWTNVWDPLFLASIVNAPRHLASGVPHHLSEGWAGMAPGRGPQWHFVPHHVAHAASAYHPSPFAEAAVMTVDGRGERATTTFGRGVGDELQIIAEVHLPSSLGLLYEDVTQHLGFLRSSDEYKVMALASYGKPTFAPLLREAIRIREDGGYAIDPVPLTEWFGPARERGAALTQHHFDIAHSLQLVLEESLLRLAQGLHRAVGSQNLCLAGGVALNCVANSRLWREGPFAHVWVQPAAGDAGTALGAALQVDRDLNGAGATRKTSAVMDHAYLGPSFTDEEIRTFLDWAKQPYRQLTDVAEETAQLLAEGAIIGWFQGAMEMGPRALGARSILASPVPEDMQARLNDIKEREDFRPVAPVVLEEAAQEWFDGPHPSPFMLFVHEVRPEKAARIPAVRHIDGTARVQTVNAGQHPLYHALLQAFGRRTGVPILVNTSFNTRSGPIVCSPKDAVECFASSPLDALVIGSFLLLKRPSP